MNYRDVRVKKKTNLFEHFHQNVKYASKSEKNAIKGLKATEKNSGRLKKKKKNVAETKL